MHWLTDRRIDLAGIALALLLCTPSVWHGWQSDDYTHQITLQGHPDFPDGKRHFSRLFCFLDDRAPTTQSLIEDGMLPWWTNPSLKLSFFRPVTGLTHWLDYRLWPDSPAMMHAHSLAWFALALFLTTRLLRSHVFTGAGFPPWIAGLACLLFVLDDGHGVPATWIANRNSMIALALGVAAMLCHIRGRMSRSVYYVAAAPVLLAASLLSNEGAIAICGYLFAFALFIDRGTWVSRVLSLLPSALTASVWMIFYKSSGYGATGSATYIDPASSPVRFLEAAAERFPLLNMGQWLAPSDFYYLLSRDAKFYWYIAALGVTALLSAWFLAALRNRPTSRFFLLGMVISMIPLCATFSSDRLLVFTGIGAAGLMAEFIAVGGAIRLSLHAPSAPGDSALPRGGTPFIYRIGAWSLLIIHIGISPLSLAAKPFMIEQFGRMLTDAALRIPSDSTTSERTWILLNTPTSFLQLSTPVIRASHGRAPLPRRMVTLYAGIAPLRVERTDPHTLVLRPAYPLMQPSDTIPHNSTESSRAQPGAFVPLIDPNNMASVFDGLLTDNPRFATGTRIENGEFVVEVLSRDETGGLVQSYACVFPGELESAQFVWMTWTGRTFKPLSVPPVGGVLDLPAARLPMSVD